VIQALFFADGGLLALGCNIFNLGIFPAFVAHPLIYRPLCGQAPSTGKRTTATVAAAIVGLQLGSFSVVLETVLSGISALPFTAFVSLMQPIHLGIGLVEGVVTAIIVGFVHKARPDIFIDNATVRHGFMKSIVPAFLALTLVTGGFISWLASEKPDGLEWSIEKVTGEGELAGANNGLHARLAALQEKLSFLPGYNFKKPEGAKPEVDGKNEGGSRVGTSMAGIAGALLTLGLALLVGFVLRKRQQLAATRPHSHEHVHPHRHEHEHLHSHGHTSHSHGHSHEHTHPHPHVHDHSQPHQADPNPQHTHEARVDVHCHGHDDSEHGSHEHHHDEQS
jgi:cobalt/nickel transport system permease protein